MNKFIKDYVIEALKDCEINININDLDGIIENINTDIEDRIEEYIIIIKFLEKRK